VGGMKEGRNEEKENCNLKHKLLGSQKETENEKKLLVLKYLCQKLP
jgi:hypothetical protein